MPVTKYDLHFIANNYFVWSLTSPKHPITPDVCDKFVRDCYSYIVAIPVDGNAYRQLLEYIQATANHYGIDISKAIEYCRLVPGMVDIFIQYMKDNYGIQATFDLKKFVSDIFNEIGDTLASALWSLIKPFIPIAILALVGIYAFNRTSRQH